MLVALFELPRQRHASSDAEGLEGHAQDGGGLAAFVFVDFATLTTISRFSPRARRALGLMVASGVLLDYFQIVLDLGHDAAVVGA